MRKLIALSAASIFTVIFTLGCGDDYAGDENLIENGHSRPFQLAAVGMGPTAGYHVLWYFAEDSEVRYVVDLVDSERCGPVSVGNTGSFTMSPNESQEFADLIASEEIRQYGAPMSEVDPWFAEQDVICPALARYAQFIDPRSGAFIDILSGTVGDSPSEEFLELESRLQDFFERSGVAEVAPWTVPPELPR